MKFGHARGFTLVEVLVAVFIFALLLIVAYGSVNALLRTRDGLAEQSEKLRRLQFAVGRIERDLRSGVARSVRSDNGETEAALLGTRDMIALTHAGLANPFGRERAQIERVAYLVREHRLQQVRFAALDRAASTPPMASELLDGIDRIGFRYFDGRRWLDRWPPMQSGATGLQRLPNAVEFRIDTATGGSYVRLVDLPVAVPAPAEGTLSP